MFPGTYEGQFLRAKGAKYLTIKINVAARGARFISDVISDFL